MVQQSKGKIFLSDERNCEETDKFRCCSTFNFRTFFNKNKTAFGDLCVLNDIALAGNQSLNIDVKETCIVLVIPVVGGVSYADNSENKILINAGQIYAAYLSEDSFITLSNPYADGLINFLYLQIKAAALITNNKASLFNFDISEKNKLIEVIYSGDFPIMSIGKFDGREEAFYKPKSKTSNLFVYVIQGVFEVQGRLLHARDGLALWQIAEDIELEALSNDAIVLMLEV